MTYRGWSITFDYGYYNATGPDYDASWEGDEDGWVDNGQKASARTLDDLHAEIDEWFAASVDTHPQGGDAVAARFMGSAVPKADAQ